MKGERCRVKGDRSKVKGERGKNEKKKGEKKINVRINCVPSVRMLWRRVLNKQVL